MADKVARFVYQLLSTLWSPDKNQISSASLANSAREAGTYVGWAMIASACQTSAFDTVLAEISAHLLPTTYDRFIGSQPCQSQCPDFGSYTHFLSFFAIVWKLNTALQCQSLGDKMIIHKIKCSSRQQICRDVQVASIASAQLKRIDREAMVRYMCVCGR